MTRAFMILLLSTLALAACGDVKPSGGMNRASDFGGAGIGGAN